MTTHKTGTREEWLAARLQLLEAEKELTRRSDELARRRQELPGVRVDKDYRFETDEGNASLADLFRGRSQLLVYHFMFGPDYTAGCPSCSAIADGFDGFAVHLANHDVMLWAVALAPHEHDDTGCRGRHHDDSDQCCASAPPALSVISAAALAQAGPAGLSSGGAGIDTMENTDARGPRSPPRAAHPGPARPGIPAA